MPQADPIADLILRMEQAQKSGRTAEDQEKFKTLEAFGRTLIDLVEAQEKVGILRATTLHALARILGLLIKHMTDPGIKRLIAASLLVDMVMNAALEEGGPTK